MELDDLTVTRLFDVMTIPIAGGTRKQIKNRYGYGLTFCRTVNGKIVYEFRGREFVSGNEQAVLLSERVYTGIRPETVGFFL